MKVDQLRKIIESIPDDYDVWIADLEFFNELDKRDVKIDHKENKVVISGGGP